eukprot:TRINITY_DN66689_c0_g1_i1.p1 TRINITY_DN66689_c0_g1~~TRINITY_DN66689_c0_g1_i1.p1  ORF type:complete len:127 (+),score=34.40 TRINITY_DN66689_c0_g1_i1:39-419(+)
MVNGDVHAIVDEEAFTKALEEAGESRLVVVMFTAVWSFPSCVIAEGYQELANEMVDIDFLTIDIDENQVLSDRYKIEATPTFIMLRDKEEKGNIMGANLDKVREGIQKALIAKPSQDDGEDELDMF